LFSFQFENSNAIAPYLNVQTHSIMEEDRLVTNLGPGVDDGFESEKIALPKQPKRRFIGRRAANQAAQNRSAEGGIEDSAAIQGVNNPYVLTKL
jgi:hypothetical protein